MRCPSDGVDLDLDASPVELVLEVDLRERKGAVQRRDPRLPRRDPAAHLSLIHISEPTRPY